MRAIQDRLCHRRLNEVCFAPSKDGVNLERPPFRHHQYSLRVELSNSVRIDVGFHESSGCQDKERVLRLNNTDTECSVTGWLQLQAVHVFIFCAIEGVSGGNKKNVVWNDCLPLEQIVTVSPNCTVTNELWMMSCILGCIGAPELEVCSSN